MNVYYENPNKSEMLSNFVFFKQKMIKKLIFNKTKNTSVRFFTYMSSMCVHLFTAFEEAVLSYMYLGQCPKIEYGRHFHGNQLRKLLLFFFSIFFHTDHNKYTMK